MARPLLERAEKLVNRHIGESASAVRVLEELENRSLRIRVEGLGIDWLLVVEQGRLRILSSDDRPASAAVSGTPIDLLRLLGPGMASRIHGSGVTLTGQIHVAEQFAELLRLALPDPEEDLSRWIGDIAAHEVGRAARGAGAWAAKAANALRLDTSEYLTEESRALPSRYEAEAFYRDVERLRDDVERAAARIEHLALSLRGLEPRAEAE